MGSVVGSKARTDLTEAAHRNHEELFPNHKSVIKQTDPELIEIFDNWAFDEVLKHSVFNTKTRVLVTLAAMIGAQGISEYRVMLGAALNVGLAPVEIKEMLYQSTAYVGMAKAFDFIHATNEVLKSRGILEPVESQSTTKREERFEAGLKTQKAIFGEEAISKMFESCPEDQLHIQNFLASHCFGDFYTRSGLDLKQRELITLSILVGMGGTESQMKGHIRGNANVGNDRKVLMSLLTQLLPWVGYPRTLTALGCLNEILPLKGK